MEKDLEIVARPHYANEIRKNINLDNLNNLKLDQAWPFLKDEIESTIGCKKLVCIPYITEVSLYKKASMFVDNNEKWLNPLGKLSNYLKKFKTNEEVVNSLIDDYKDANSNVPHESIKITLQDQLLKNKISVVMMSFTRSVLPFVDKYLDGVYLDVDRDELKGKRSVFIISEVLSAGSVEFRVESRGVCSRIFHLSSETPLVFKCEEFRYDEDGRITSMRCVDMMSDQLHWIRKDPSDFLYCEAERN